MEYSRLSWHFFSVFGGTNTHQHNLLFFFEFSSVAIAQCFTIVSVQHFGLPFWRTSNRASWKHTSKTNILSEEKCDSQRCHYNFHSILWAIFIFLFIFSSTSPKRAVFHCVCTDHILHLSAKIKLCKFIFLFCRYIYNVSYFIMWFYFIFTFFFDSQLPMRHTHTQTHGDCCWLQFHNVCLCCWNCVYD